ncbi:hypothetical protein DdX_13179 [Ditylenchus destructor]|uniref:ShKT domain-containing protein n=1 Tax=Ditylenchus destructor TaxID=166010 RepID=A0AAD4MTZ3_9BILA|nr:hypothetical protein DdX_13179 [Ditylenchus destructor]
MRQFFAISVLLLLGVLFCIQNAKDAEAHIVLVKRNGTLALENVPSAVEKPSPNAIDMSSNQDSTDLLSNPQFQVRVKRGTKKPKKPKTKGVRDPKKKKPRSPNTKKKNERNVKNNRKRKNNRNEKNNRKRKNNRGGSSLDSSGDSQSRGGKRGKNGKTRNGRRKGSEDSEVDSLNDGSSGDDSDEDSSVEEGDESRANLDDIIGQSDIGGGRRRHISSDEDSTSEEDVSGGAHEMGYTDGRSGGRRQRRKHRDRTLGTLTGRIAYDFDKLPQEPEDIDHNCHHIANRCTDPNPEQREWMNRNCQGTCGKLGLDGRDIAANCEQNSDLCPRLCPQCSAEVTDNMYKYCRATCDLHLQQSQQQQVGQAPYNQGQVPFNGNQVPIGGVNQPLPVSYQGGNGRSVRDILDNPRLANK